MKKKQTKSINTVLYILMASMLVLVVLVSAFTIASRRGAGQNPPVGSDTGDVTTGNTESTADTENKPSSGTSTETAPVTDTKPEDTTESKKTNTEISGDEKPASTDIRYFVIPTVGSISKEYEIDIPVYSLTMNDYRAHAGVDISAEIGSDVVASSSGIVAKIWNDPMMGCSIKIDHGDNIYTTYQNLAPDSTGSLEVGDRVEMGQTIGAIGESALIEIAEAPHVHVEMTVDGNYVNPIEYMSASRNEADIYED